MEKFLECCEEIVQVRIDKEVVHLITERGGSVSVEGEMKIESKNNTYTITPYEKNRDINILQYLLGRTIISIVYTSKIAILFLDDSWKISLYQPDGRLGESALINIDDEFIAIL